MAILAVGAVRAIRAIGSGRTLGTLRADRSLRARGSVGHLVGGRGSVGVSDGVGVNQTVGARLGNGLDADTGCCHRAVQTVGHGESGDGAVRIMDGVGIHITGTHRAGDVGNAASVRAVSASRADRTLRARLALQALVALRALRTSRTNRTLGSLRTLLPVVQHKGVWAVSIGDGYHSAIAGGDSIHNGGEAILAVGAVRAIRTIGSGRTNRTLRTLRALDALLSVAQHKGVRAVSIGDGHDGAVASGSGGYNGRETVLAGGALWTLGARLTLRSLRTRRTACSSRAVGHRKCACRAVGIGDGVGVGQAVGHGTDNVQDAAAVSSCCAWCTRGTVIAINTIGHRECRGGGIGVDDGVGIYIAVCGRTDDVRDATTVRAGRTRSARSTVVAVGDGKG